MLRVARNKDFLAPSAHDFIIVANARGRGGGASNTLQNLTVPDN
jgi:hypothetical protein